MFTVIFYKCHLRHFMSHQRDFLRQRLLNAWYSTEQHVIDVSTDKWRARLTTYVSSACEDDRYFEVQHAEIV